MAEKVLEVGKIPDRIAYSDVQLERKGFLNIFSFRYAEDGGGSHPRELMERGSAVVVLPVDFAARELYMIEQGRHLRIFAESDEGVASLRDGGASFEKPFDAVKTLEIPAGIIDHGETPEQAAVRELHEETGIQIPESALSKIATYYPSVGGCTERITAYFAELSGTPTQDSGDGDDLERIIVWKMSFDEAFEALDSGRIVTASSMIVLRELKIRDLQHS